MVHQTQLAAPLLRCRFAGWMHTVFSQSTIPHVSSQLLVTGAPRVACMLMRLPACMQAMANCQAMVLMSPDRRLADSCCVDCKGLVITCYLCPAGATCTALYKGSSLPGLNAAGPSAQALCHS